MFSLLIVPVLAAVPSARPQTPTPPIAIERNVLDRSASAGSELLTVAAPVDGAAGPSIPAAVLPEVGVPFACGARFPVSQGHATGSHQSHDTYAWDFRMPEGTPITAARSGVVRLARGDSRQGGCDAKMARHANYVVLEHAGDLETQYLHFSSVVVKVGERVEEGQLLGYSGNTGWSCGPHLHFKVARRQSDGWNNPSLPAMLAGHGDPVRGTLVTAPSCQEAPKKQYAERDPNGGDVRASDVEVGAALPDGLLPVRPASALGGADAQGTTKPATGTATPAKASSPPARR